MTRVLTTADGRINVLTDAGEVIGHVQRDQYMATTPRRIGARSSRAPRPIVKWHAYDITNDWLNVEYRLTDAVELVVEAHRKAIETGSTS